MLGGRERENRDGNAGESELASRRKEMLSGEKGWKAPIDWVNGPRNGGYVLIDGVNAGSRGEIQWENLKVPKG